LIVATVGLMFGPMANIFTKKSPSAKLERSLADLREREAALSLKRANAQTLFDEATGERSEFLLGGDLADDGKAAKLQARVDSTASQIKGIDDALAALAGKINDIERTLMAEREQVERAEASTKLAQQVAALEAAMPQWLEASRRLHAALMAVDARSFEIDALAQFLLGTCMAQIEVAVAFALDELKRTVEAVKQGAAPMPREKVEAVVVEMPTGPSPTSAGEPVVEVFTLRPVQWRGRDGRQHYVAQYDDAQLPQRLHARATQRGAVTSLDAPERRTHRGMFNAFPKATNTLCDLDVEKLPVDANPIPPGFEPLDRGPPRTMSVAVTPARGSDEVPT
jgi:hypothetical protein